MSSRSATVPSSAMKSTWWFAGSAAGDDVTVTCWEPHLIDPIVVVALLCPKALGFSTPLEASAPTSDLMATGSKNAS